MPDSEKSLDEVALEDLGESGALDAEETPAEAPQPEGDDATQQAEETPPEPEPAAQPQPNPEEWWNRPEVQAQLENMRQTGYMQAQSEAQVRSEMERISQMDDEEYGRYAREVQAQMAAQNQTKQSVGQEIAQRVWQDLISIPEFTTLTREEQAEVWYGTGNPYVAAAQKIAEKKAQAKFQELVEKSSKEAIEARVNQGLAEAHANANAPVTGSTAPNATPVIGDWDDYFAAKDREKAKA